MRTIPLQLVLVSLLVLCAAQEPPKPAGQGVFETIGDIGKVDLAGSTEFNAAKEEYRVTGNGANIWGTEDAFQFACRKVSGDFTITADIAFVGEGKNAHRKAGLMFRQTLAADAPYADVMVHGDGLIALQYRPTAGAATTQAKSDVKAPVTVQLQRRGNVFTLSVAAKGEAMHAVSTATVELPAAGHLGLGVSSHDATVRETAVFSNVSIKP
ncbi:MAG: hypothetical protein ACHRHE_18125 [Tepidisphaerales bacterium]